jgi:DNA-binding MarR family transcriptional regulator
MSSAPRSASQTDRHTGRQASRPEDRQAGRPEDRQAGRHADQEAGRKPNRDEVDEIVERWQSERPDLDVTPLHVLSRVTRLARHLDRARRAAFAAHELETWEFDVLSALRRAGQPYQLSPGTLLRATLVTSGTMTNRIDRLAQAGLVSRSRDPLDKRGVLVQLTERGRRTVDATMSDLLTRERAILTSLDTAEQSELAGLLRVLLAPFDAAGPEAAGFGSMGSDAAGIEPPPPS